MTRLALIVDIEGLGSLGDRVDLAYWRLILALMFIVAGIVWICGAARRVLGKHRAPEWV